jgi:hypothetical protein
MSIKNSSDTIGNRNRDPLACSAVPQPTAPLLDPTTAFYRIEYKAHVPFASTVCLPILTTLFDMDMSYTRVLHTKVAYRVLTNDVTPFTLHVRCYARA